MTADAWDARRKALEESFFSERNQQPLFKLKQELAKETQENALATASGIGDDEVLDQLVAADITGETLTALVLIPVVLVAWADGKMAEKERIAILAASEIRGVVAESAGHALLVSWLDELPDRAALSDAWTGYTRLVIDRLHDNARSQFRSAVLDRARRVALAAGGILGLLSVSESEQKVIDDLEAALS